MFNVKGLTTTFDVKLLHFSFKSVLGTGTWWQAMKSDREEERREEVVRGEAVTVPPGDNISITIVQVPNADSLLLINKCSRCLLPHHLITYRYMVPGKKRRRVKQQNVVDQEFLLWIRLY
jgi:hypothetical protein